MVTQTLAKGLGALPRLLPLCLGLGLGLCPGGGLAAEEAPRYSLSAEAATSLTLAAEGLDPAVADSAALWGLTATFLHRIEARGWGLVLSHSLDLSGQAAATPSFAPTLTVYEAYTRLDIDDWGQLFVGKRRMGLGVGTTFAPGDLIDPRSGFWDQKSGFRGLDLSASVGSELAIRAALSLDRNFDAWAAGMRAKAAPALRAAYLASRDGAAGPADPRLLVGALSADALFGALQVSVAGVFSQDSIARPSAGLSYDLGGVILVAEGAVELAGGLDKPAWYGTAGARYTWSADSVSATLALDYDYNGAPGILRQTNYVLPMGNLVFNDLFSLTARALVEVDSPSALVSAILTLYPVPGFDLEFTVLACLGAAGGEFASLAAPPSAGPDPATDAIGFAARVHF